MHLQSEETYSTFWSFKDNKCIIEKLIIYCNTDKNNICDPHNNIVEREFENISNYDRFEAKLNLSPAKTYNCYSSLINVEKLSSNSTNFTLVIPPTGNFII